MCCCDKIIGVAVSLCLAAGSAQAGSGYILGLAAEADTADGRAVSAFADLGLTETTWLSFALGRTNTGSELTRLETYRADFSIEQTIGAVGARIGAGYWGDSDILDSNDIRGAVFVRGRGAGLSVDLQRRNFDFIVEGLRDSDRRRQVEFSADGLGASAWLRAGERVTLFASGMNFDYSRDIRLTDNIEILNFLSTSRLSLMNSLIDYRLSAGIDVAVGERIVGISLGQWQTAIDGGKVNSVGLDYVSPAGASTDLELRLALDDSQNFGRTIAFSIGIYFFGD